MNYTAILLHKDHVVARCQVIKESVYNNLTWRMISYNYDAFISLINSLNLQLHLFAINGNIVSRYNSRAVHDPREATDLAALSLQHRLKALLARSCKARWRTRYEIQKFHPLHTWIVQGNLFPLLLLLPLSFRESGVTDTWFARLPARSRSPSRLRVLVRHLGSALTIFIMQKITAAGTSCF